MMDHSFLACLGPRVHAYLERQKVSIQIDPNNTVRELLQLVGGGSAEHSQRGKGFT
jgi:hypothetical protein